MYDAAKPTRTSAVSEVAKIKQRGWVEVVHIEEDIYMFASSADQAVAWMCDAIVSSRRNFMRGQKELNECADRIRQYMKLATNVVEPADMQA
jgi:hypothetical protein